MNESNASITLASWKQRILYWNILAPTKSAEWQFLINGHIVVGISVFYNIIIHFIGIHLCYGLFIHYRCWLNDNRFLFFGIFDFFYAFFNAKNPILFGIRLSFAASGSPHFHFLWCILRQQLRHLFTVIL